MDEYLKELPSQSKFPFRKNLITQITFILNWREVLVGGELLATLPCGKPQSLNIQSVTSEPK